MPTLPAAGYAVPVAPSVDPLAGVPGSGQEIRVPTGAFGERTAEALGAFGAQAEQASQSFVRIQSFYDQVASDEKVNQVETRVNKLMDDYTALQGDAAMNARDPTLKAITQTMMEARAKVGNLNQQHLFDQQVRRFHNVSQSQVRQHYNRESLQWAKSTATNSIKLGIDRANQAANNDDFTGFQDALGAALLSVEKIPGETPEAREHLRNEITKTTASNWAKNKIVKDPLGAIDFIEQNKDHLGDQYDTLLGAARQKADDLQVDDAIQGKPVRKGVAPRIGEGTGTFFDRIVDKGERSSQEQVSPKGAVGKSQMLPSTAQETAAANGVPWDENRFRTDERYNRQLGKLHADRLLTKYNGNETLAAAAYNAGEGTVDGWLRDIGDPRTGRLSNKDFVDRIPFAETRDYVRRVGAETPIAQLQGGGTRNLPIARTLNVQLERASAAVGDLKVEVFSGGQPSSGPNRVGSHRHDRGEAGDIQLRDIKTGKLLDMRVPADQARMARFITAAVANGATGVGAAPDYMGPHGLHVGGGNVAVWGGDQTQATAPGWVRAAFEAGRAGTPASLTPPRGGSGGGQPDTTDSDVGYGGGGDDYSDMGGGGDDTAPPGFAERMGAVEKRLIDAGREDLVPRARARLRQEMNNEYTDLQHKRIEAEQLQKKVDDKFKDDTLKRMTADSPNRPTTDEILSAPNISPETKQNMVRFLEAQLKPDPLGPISAQTQMDLIRRMSPSYEGADKVTSEAQIDKAYNTDRKLTFDAWRQTRDHFREIQDPAGKKLEVNRKRVRDIAEAKIIPMRNFFTREQARISDPDGQQRFYEWELEVDEKIKEYRDGEKNPNDLFNPSKPEYVGSKEFLEKHVPKAGQQLGTGLGAPPPGTPQAVPRVELQAIPDGQLRTAVGRERPDGTLITIDEVRAEVLKRGLARPNPPTVEVPVR